MELSKVFEDWPAKMSVLEIARNKKNMLNESEIREKYERVEKEKTNYDKLEKHKNALVEISQEDLNTAKKLQNKKKNAETRLAGMNLVARIKQLGELPIEVKTVLSGQNVDLHNEECSITEAVNIVIPGVMEMQLIPQGVNVEIIENEINIARKESLSIFEKYGVKDLEELQSEYDEYDKCARDIENAKTKLDNVLNGESWEEIEAENSKIKGVVLPTSEIKAQIKQLCGRKNIDVFIGGAEATINSYIGKYISMENLERNIENIRKEQSETKKKLDAIEGIPDEYKGIKDPEGHDKSLAAAIEEKNDEIDKLNNELNDHIRKLKDRSAEEYFEDLFEREKTFNEEKAKYVHWNNINNVFCNLKEQLTGNPVEDIEKRFREYLSIITDGNLELRSMDEKMNAELINGNHKLAYDILSNGTKDTISLAFRLAMLEHLYPEGNGLAVFDDPFTEMDPNRVRQACSLIEKFAENNQVVFITCDEKYKDLLPSGNIIEISA